MDKDDIIRLALEAGITFKPMVVDGVEYEYRHVDCNDSVGGDEAGCVELFAALVSAAERERICAAIKAEDDHTKVENALLMCNECHDRFNLEEATHHLSLSTE